jgi:hypothetical protein
MTKENVYLSLILIFKAHHLILQLLIVSITNSNILIRELRHGTVLGM